jgi:hypothetical protein
MLDPSPAVAEAPAERSRFRRHVPRAALVRVRKFRPHVPRAVLVAVLGFALSAWLVPAMTRQWDDRHKEHELKAAVVANMASSSARALLGGEAVWSGHQPTARERKQFENEWELSILGLEARLRAYFPRSVVTDWEVYAWAVDRFIDARSPSASAALQDAVQSGAPLDPRVADPTAKLLALLPDGPGPSFGKSAKTPISDSTSIARLRKMLSPELEQYQKNAAYAKWTAFEKQLLYVEQGVADQVLRSHAAGFSTTPRDLMHDLLP